MAGSTGFQSAVFPLALDGLTVPGYAALYALIVNFAVAIVLSAVLNPIGATRGTDQTTPADYHYEPPAAA
jgi:SSS family solute:Na+ symporter